LKMALTGGPHLSAGESEREERGGPGELGHWEMVGRRGERAAGRKKEKEKMGGPRAERGREFRCFRSATY
jgi:hypothetical protein